MSFTAPQSMAEQIAAYLAQQIIDGSLVSKQRIQELKVVAELDVSRGSVREALLLLEQRHLIEILPRRGAMVAELSAESATSLFEVFNTLLIRLVILVAERWQGEELDPLIRQIAEIQKIAQQEDRTLFMKQVFHLLDMAYPLARNKILEEILVDLQPAIHRCYALAQRYQPNDGEAAINFFAGLLQAVTTRNTVKVPAVVDSYISHELDLVLAALKQEQ